MTAPFLAKVGLASGRILCLSAASLAQAEQWIAVVKARREWRWSSVSDRGFLIRWAQVVEVR